MKSTRHTANHIDIIDAPELHEQTSSGRATWDERGNTIWEWQTAPGIYSREVSTQQLQALQAAELELVDQYPGYPSTYSHWKRQYQSGSRSAPRRENEMIVPARSSSTERGTTVFDQFLKGLGLTD